MKRSTVFAKGICIFCATVLLTGTLSSCSEVTNQIEGLFPSRPSQYTQPTQETSDPSSVTTLPAPSEESLPSVTEPTVKPSKWTGEVTASVLNIRERPGTDYEIVRGLERGSRVVILEQTTVNGEPWGKIAEGWVSMKYVALDGVIEGSWYEMVDAQEDAYLYRIWSFHSDHTFMYTKCSLKPSEEFSISRTLSQGGGQYRFDGERLELELSHGDRVTVCGGYVDVTGSATVDAEIYGATMTWDTHGAELTRGSLETIQKKLRNP